MFRMFWTSIIYAVVTILFTGVLYPYLVTGCSQLLFPSQANGSLITDSSGSIVGSELIAQPFTEPSYFHPRPSAAGSTGYDPMSSGGSNLGQTSKKLLDRITAEVARLRTENPQATGPIPLELVTTSASGLDPDLSPAAAEWQIPRIAAARGVAGTRVLQVLQALCAPPQYGFLGEARVNVLKLNIALDNRFGKTGQYK